MKKLFIFQILLFLFSSASSQDLNYEKSTDVWNEGSIKLNDGTILSGLLLYNTKTAILRFENGGVSKSLTARSVASYNYMDGATSQNRTFFSIEYEDSRTGAKRPLFFEFHKEYSKFAVLSKIDPVDITQTKTAFGNGATAFPISNSSQIKITQAETIYFLKPGEKITPILRTTNTEINGDYGDGLLFSIPVKYEKTKRKIEGRALLESYTEPYYAQLKEFAKENNLSFKIKDDLLRILDFYETLVSK